MEQHYRENYERLVRVVQNKEFTNNKNFPLCWAEEIVQETYTRALEQYHDDVKDFNKWIQQILNNCIADKRKDELHRGVTHLPEGIHDLYEDIIELFRGTNDR